jgi:DNA polymerase I
LLLADEGCKLVIFDLAQQEPAIAAFLSGDSRLLHDYLSGDVYTLAGRRMGLIRPGMTAAEVRTVRNGLLKALMLSVIYGKSTGGIARDLSCPLHEARTHLARFRQTYPRLFEWLQAYVGASLGQGWAENVVGYRAAFNVRDPTHRAHVARSCQNFPIQSSAAMCFQAVGLHLARYGADVRLGIHDSYILNVPHDPGVIARTEAQITAATEAAADEMFPGLPMRHNLEVLGRFASDGREGSLDELLTSLAQGAYPCPAV